MISHQYKLVHVHIPKNAGTTINAMIPKDHKPQLPYEPNLTDDLSAFKCGAAELYRNLIGVDQWCGYTSFAVLRNPWDRLVSGWKFKAPDMDFKDFVSQLDAFRNKPSVLWHVITPQIKHITDAHGEIIVKEIGKTESLDDFMKYLSTTYNFPIRVVKPKNTTDHLHYTKYYNDATRALVDAYFADDIKLGGYKFGD